MKKLVLFLFSLCVIFAGSFAATRWVQTGKEPALQKEAEGKEILDNRFRPNPYPLENRSFTIVITGINNGASVQKTLNSVFNQVYENYQVVYIDDASDDGSFELARDLIYDSGHFMQVTMVRNERRLGALANLVRAVEICADDEIVVVLNGEDWLAHEWVLQTLNRYYADPDLWMTYGQYRDFPSYQLGSSRPFLLTDLGEQGFRGHPFVASHLKTFYAGLFKKIDGADFLYQGQVLPSCSELAYMLPMLEMAQEHFQFISEVLYISNRQAVSQGASKEERELQAKCERYVRGMNGYQPLASLALNFERNPLSDSDEEE